jgi:hypothetical protein
VDVASFRLHLAADNKAAGTIRIYTEAPLWFAAAHLLGETDKTRWSQVDSQDVQRWVAWLLGSYSEAYARQQYRALRQFFTGSGRSSGTTTTGPGAFHRRGGLRPANGAARAWDASSRKLLPRTWHSDV